MKRLKDLAVVIEVIELMNKIEKEELWRYFRELSKEVTANFNKIRYATNHPEAKGRGTEDIVKGFLDDYFSNLYNIHTRRQIIDSSGNKTHQFDVILTHKNMVIESIAGKSEGYLFAESVACVIEVKSELNMKELKESIIKLREIKNLVIAPKELGNSNTNKIEKPKTIVFAFRTKLTKKSLYDLDVAIPVLKKAQHELGITNKERIDALVLHEKGLILNYTSPIQPKVKKTKRDYFAIVAREDTLLNFLLWLQLSLDVAFSRKFNPYPYFYKGRKMEFISRTK